MDNRNVPMDVGTIKFCNRKVIEKNIKCSNGYNRKIYKQFFFQNYDVIIYLPLLSKHADLENNNNTYPYQ